VGTVSAATLVAALVATFVSIVGHAPAGAAVSFNYAEALQKSIWFYDAQRLGRLPSTNRVSWRGDSFLTDGADASLDLTGGFADAGDHIKATFPLAHTLTTLAWSLADNPEGYTASGQTSFALSNLRWGMDYLIKAHPSANRLVAEVADPNLDHQVWAAAEVQNYTRTTYFVDSTCGGSDVAASSAAAFAASYLVFRSSDPTYAATLLTHAQQLYTFADTVRKKYSDCVPIIHDFYNSWSGYYDELTWGALWLYRATGTASYLDKAKAAYELMNRSGQGSTIPEYAWTYDWDDKAIASQVMMAKLTNDPKYITDANHWADWLTAPAGFNSTKATYSPGGQVFIGNWGSLRYSASTAMLALYYADAGIFDATRVQRLHDFAVRQVNYILGDNPIATSYMVGFGAKYVTRPHHRTAHGPWGNSPIQDPVENRHILYGALIGGPKAADDTYGAEDRNDFQKAEVALDYNAGLVGALARLTKEFGGTALANFPPAETKDTEQYVLASLNASGSNFFEIKALLQNKSAWPARALTNGSFRYYFTLDPGVTPSQIQLQANYHQCTAPTGITQFSGSVYYVTISCAGVRIAPTGQPDYTKENQFRVIFPGPHDYTKDWSFAGVSLTSGSPTLANNIELYDGTTKVFGNPPGPAATPPGAPGQPSASNITSNSVVLTWTAATAGTNPIGGYDVYRVGTPDAVVASTTGALTTTVSGLLPSTGYTFYVKARDNTGLSGAASLTRAVTTAPGPTTSTTTTSPPPSGTSCRVTYTILNQWATGFGTDINIANTGTTTINGWTLTFTFPGNQVMTEKWNATWTQTGAAVTATALSWNSSIAPAASVSIGFNASYSGTNSKPTAFALNGRACTVG
jgi:endoglucanase